jgi:two-component system sensor histidine kinase HydH
MLKKTLLTFGAGLSLFLLWFAVSDYRAAGPIAMENLRGLALTLAAAVENSVQQDPSFASLSRFHPPDVAFLAIIDRKGIIRFHSNADLIGTATHDPNVAVIVQNRSTYESRVVLGTGESAFELVTPLYIRGEVLLLRLTLHTFRADVVIRRASLNSVLLVALLVTGWVLSIILYRFAQREERHQLEMVQQENLARLGEMGAMLAHEIRNPLAGIKGFAQVIEKKPSEERNSKFAQRIVTEVLRLETLVSDLLAYARSDRFTTSTVDLKELIDHTVALVRPEADQLRVSVKNDFPAGLRTMGNQDRLGQLLLNLAKNALQAMPDGGLLRISAGTIGRDVIIIISDTGLGISKEDVARIFEPFFTTKARGTGLGLPLCKKIVEEHNGTISVASNAGRGTKISISLPLLTGNYSGGSRL